MSKMQFQTITLTATDQDSSPTTVTKSTDAFDGPIISFGAAIAGWELGYTSDDHHLRRMQVAVSNASIDPSDSSKVTVEVSLAINDKNSDDRWSGSVDVLVAAEVAQS